MIPPVTLDIQALRDGVMYGLLLTMGAGMVGWSIRTVMVFFKKIAGG